MNNNESISPQQLSENLFNKDIKLIDVRTPAEYREVHVKFAENIPLDKLKPEQFAEYKNSDRTIYFICKSGSRGASACKKMRTSGYNKVCNVDGGTDACIKAGVPLINGEKTISIERQVRMLAGSIVFISAVLTLTLHVHFVLIAAFIGAGLVFSGVTDTCGMAILLGKMPWNR